MKLTTDLLRKALDPTIANFSLTVWITDESGNRAVYVSPKDILEYVEQQDRRLVLLASLFADKQL